MSNRFKKIFANKSPKTKMIAYFVACYPNFEQSLEIIKKSIDAGVSICEIGFPTQEASGEGIVIKNAHDHCLERNITLKETLKLARAVRDYNKDVGIILMGYMSNVFKYPIDNFVKDLVATDSDGCLIVDAPHELKEENELRDALNDNGLSLIKLAAPTTDQKRLEDIVKISSGFIYQVNVSGVTGVKSANETDVANFVKRIKSLTKIPVCSGFGIKSPEDAKKVANSGCNGVIVGSTFVKYIQDNINAPDLTQSFGKQVQSFSEVLK